MKLPVNFQPENQCTTLVVAKMKWGSIERDCHIGAAGGQDGLHVNAPVTIEAIASLAMSVNTQRLSRPIPSADSHPSTSGHGRDAPVRHVAAGSDAVRVSR